MIERKADWFIPDKREEALRSVMDPLQAIIDGAGIPRLQGELTPNKFYLSLESRSITFKEVDDETFRFSGEVLVNGKPDVPESRDIPTAIIRTIILPLSMQRKTGLGTLLVTTWQNAWRELGITSFVAAGVIQHPDTLHFWDKLGYKPSASYPGHMYKRI